MNIVKELGLLGLGAALGSVFMGVDFASTPEAKRGRSLASRIDELDQHAAKMRKTDPSWGIKSKGRRGARERAAMMKGCAK